MTLPKVLPKVLYKLALPLNIEFVVTFPKVEPQEDGQFCVFKTLPIESIEKTAVQQCVHRFVFFLSIVSARCYRQSNFQSGQAVLFLVHNDLHSNNGGRLFRELQEEMFHRVHSDKVK